MLLKVDPTKAYDRINKKFMDETLTEENFVPKRHITYNIIALQETYTHWLGNQGGKKHAS